jgi:hypothetical protein
MNQLSNAVAREQVSQGKRKFSEALGEGSGGEDPSLDSSTKAGDQTSVRACQVKLDEAKSVCRSDIHPS